MEATITKDQYTGKIGYHRKEKHFVRQYTVINRSFNELITMRFYSTPSVSYACVWINGRNPSVSLAGAGRANGYGYHRASAAAMAALQDAGIILSESIDGRGDSAIEEALKAVATKLTNEPIHIVEAYA
jgi:hypothetical protein